MSTSTAGGLHASFDFTYLAPAVLCNLAFVLGAIPALFCVSGVLFAYFSVGIFIVSIGVHIYILFRWTKYKNSSPFAYAIIQPALHMIMLVYALAVGSTNICVPVKVDRKSALIESELNFPASRSISDAIAEG